MQTFLKLLPLPLVAAGVAAFSLPDSILPLATPAFAAHSLGQQQHPGRAVLKALFEKRLALLGVSDTQKRQLHNLLRDARPRVQPLVNRFVAEKRALRGLMQSGTVDEAAIRAQAARVAAVGADLAVERARITQNARAVLTPEQIDKITWFQTRADAHIDAFIERLFQQLD